MYYTSLIFLFLSLLCLFFYVLIQQKSNKRSVSKFTKLEKETTHFIQKFSGKSFWTTPGFLVKKTSKKEKLKKQIKSINQPFTLSNFLGFKQFLVTILSLYFWAWVWFGEVSSKSFFSLTFIIILTFILPDLWLKMKAERHLNRIREDIPYFIDLLALTLHSGLNIEQSLKYTTQSQATPLTKTINRKLEETQLGKSLDQVLSELKSEVDNTEFEHFISSIMRAKKLGVSLSDTLEIQSNIIRTRRRQKAEELSRTAAVKLSLPLVLFIFPALLIIYIGPGLLNLMNQT